MGMNRTKGSKSIVLGRGQETELQVAPPVWALHRRVSFLMTAGLLQWFSAASESRSKVLAWPLWSRELWSHLWVNGPALLWLSSSAPATQIFWFLKASIPAQRYTIVYLVPGPLLVTPSNWIILPSYDFVIPYAWPVGLSLDFFHNKTKTRL